MSSPLPRALRVSALPFLLTMGLLAVAAGCGDDSGGGGPAGAEDLGPAGLDTGAPPADLGAPDLGSPDLALPADLGAPDLGAPDLGSPDLGPPPGPLEQICGERDPQADLQPAALPLLGAEYLGAYDGMDPGTLETAKVIVRHPLRLRTLRAAFVGGAGTVRLRLMRSFGRSYPDLEAPDGDLIPPQELEVPAADPEAWVEIDLTPYALELLPSQHYVLVYEHLASRPALALEELLPGEASYGQLLIPGEAYPYGIEGNFRLQVEGDEFCAWQPAERWFQERGDTPFAELNSQRAAITDLDGDGHDDLVLNDGAPRAFLGDGQGGFVAAPEDTFPSSRASMLVFADLDADGDEDAFAATYVGLESDGDGQTILDGDCDDSDPAVGRGADELPGDGVDQDCDRVADDGTGIEDADADGFSPAEGDCDERRDDVYPDAPELLDGRDNDCDGEADEDFVNRIWLNDGTGRFGLRPDSGVETLDPSAAAAFGDADGDGELDLYWGNWLLHYPDAPSVQDRFVKGLGGGLFEDVTEAAGLVHSMGEAPCYGVLWADYDNDGDLDIWVGNYGYAMNFLWRNDGQGQFTDKGYAAGLARDDVGVQGGNTFGGDWGDVDNDGDLDLYAANIAHPRYQPWSDPSMFAINGGAPEFHFDNRRAELGLIYDEGDVNAAFADFDNDGDLDLAVASLYPGHYSRLYRNDGVLGFVDVSYEAGVAVEESVSPVWSDLDEDGDLDLVLADRSGAPYVHVFMNQLGQDRAWLELLLEGTNGNRDAIGARVRLQVGDRSQIREVRGGGGHSNTQGTRWVHFGLGDAEAVDALSVRWPGGQEESFTDLAPRGRYLLRQGSGRAERRD